MHASTIGLDLAKLAFQVHEADATGKVLLRKKLRRSQVEPFFASHPPALVGMEACATSHYWARIIAQYGHEVRLVPAQYVKPFVKRNKNDARDAEAICEAVSRANMPAVAVKTVAQQASRSLERARDLLNKQRVQLINCVRSLLAEFGVIAAKGKCGFEKLAIEVESDTSELPDGLKETLRALLRQIERLEPEIERLEKRILAAARGNPVMRMLTGIPGIGPITAHAMVTAIGEGKQFRSARQFAAWCGLTPLEHSSAGKRRDKGVSRQGERRLRALFALGAANLMRRARNDTSRATNWQRAILARRPMKVAILAQAAKNARIAWAMLTSGETYCGNKRTARRATTHATRQAMAQAA